MLGLVSLYATVLCVLAALYVYRVNLNSHTMSLEVRRVRTLLGISAFSTGLCLWARAQHLASTLP